MSQNLLTIHLNDIKFHGYHGLYEQEKILGNTFIVNLSLEFLAPVNGITSIDQTIDYVEIYELVKNRMQKPTPLLETIVVEIADRIFNQFPIAQKINVQITKEQMYIKSIEGNMSVSLNKTRV
jgi:dihydroneopterin aldolase